MNRTFGSLKTTPRTIASSSFSTTCRVRSPASSTSTSPASTTTASTRTETTTEPLSHYLVTLKRSPLHLDPAIKSSLASLGLYKRLSSSIVPITQQNQGYLVRAKELVEIEPVSERQVAEWASAEWRNRPGQGNQGSGLRVRSQTPGAVIRVGSERARGEERGFKISN
ncbi:hypothetical protein JCM3766R1_006662 [Sporobolomyces carnicolor]